MQIIIVGCGKIGTALASALILQGHDIVIVENDRDLIAAADHLDVIKITGVPIDRDVLRQAGIESADVLCVVTQNDNINVMVAQIAREIFHVPRIVSRIFDPVNKPVFEEFGLNTVCPTELAVKAFLNRISDEREGVVHQIFGRSVVYSTVTIDDQLIGEPISDLATDNGKSVLGVRRQNRLVPVTSDLRVQHGDELLLADLQ